MKKIISLFLILALSAAFTACSNKAEESTPSPSAENNMSGINSEVSKTETDSGAEYTFDGYFTTVVPGNVKAEDISINSDSTLFSFTDDITCLDVSFSDKITSEEEAAAEAEEIASVGSRELVDPVVINGFNFYGVTMPDYGKTCYIGFVNGNEVTISIYKDLTDPVVDAFIKNTVFVVQ